VAGVVLVSSVKELAAVQAELVALAVQTVALAAVQILAVLMVVALALTIPQPQVLCVLFIPVILAHSPQQTQEIYKWNSLFAFKMVNRSSIQFLATISVKHFLM
jgi:hypothetical protein